MKAGCNIFGEMSAVSWFGRIRKALRREFEDQAAALGITAAQLYVLHRLWQGDGIPTSILARDVPSDGGTVTGLLDRLEAKGLVRRQRSVEDRRTVHVFLTEAGCALEAPLMEIIGRINERALAGFAADERRALITALERVGENLGA